MSESNSRPTVGFASVLEQAVTSLLERPALAIPLRQRAKFEGWLKVELATALATRGFVVRLEQSYPTTEGRRHSADLAIEQGPGGGQMLIMLKTMNTNFRFRQVESRTRPVTKNVNSLIEDIEKLRRGPAHAIRYVAFAVFPVAADSHVRCTQLRPHLARIQSTGIALNSGPFVSWGAAWGVGWYYAEVR